MCVRSLIPFRAKRFPLRLDPRLHRDANGERASSRSFGPDPHQLLAEIGVLQKPHEGRRRAVEPFGDEFLVLDLALAHPPRHLAQMSPWRVAKPPTRQAASARLTVANPFRITNFAATFSHLGLGGPRGGGLWEE